MRAVVAVLWLSLVAGALGMLNGEVCVLICYALFVAQEAAVQTRTNSPTTQKMARTTHVIVGLVTSLRPMTAKIVSGAMAAAPP